MNRRHAYTGGLLVAAVVSGALWISQDDADARARPVAPVTTHASKPSEARNSLNDCGGTFTFTAKVRTTETHAGKHYAGVSIQQEYGDPHWVDVDGKHVYRTKKPGRWEYKRACLAGTGVSDGRVVTVVGHFDPCTIDGTGGPIYGIAHDLVDDDRSLDGKVRHQKVRIHVPASVLARCS